MANVSAIRRSRRGWIASQAGKSILNATWSGTGVWWSSTTASIHSFSSSSKWSSRSTVKPFALGVSGQDLAYVQVVSDPPTVTNLGNGVLCQHGRIRHIGPLQLDKPNVGRQGVSSHFFHGVVTGVAFQMPEGDAGVLLDDGQHCQKTSVPTWSGTPRRAGSGCKSNHRTVSLKLGDRPSQDGPVGSDRAVPIGRDDRKIESYPHIVRGQEAGRIALLPVERCFVGKVLPSL